MLIFFFLNNFIGNFAYFILRYVKIDIVWRICGCVQYANNNDRLIEHTSVHFFDILNLNIFIFYWRCCCTLSRLYTTTAHNNTNRLLLFISRYIFRGFVNGSECARKFIAVITWVCIKQNFVNVVFFIIALTLYTRISKQNSRRLVLI